jgi:hypothetical protein
MSKAKALLGLLEDDKEDAIESELAFILDHHNMEQTDTHGNAAEAYEGKYKDANILLEMYRGTGGAWLHLSMGFGEVRHEDSRARNHMAEHGMVEASSDHNPEPKSDDSGSAIPGHMEHKGLRWRIGGVYPKGRTHAKEVGDKYVKAEDIIAELYKYKGEVAKGSKAQGDMSADWDDAKEGW